MSLNDSDSVYVQGIYNDINSNWFLDIGQSIISTMTINIFMPAIEFLMFWVIRYLRRVYDQRKCIPGKYTKTRCKSVQEFAEIYSGIEFFIHYKYSYILTVVYIAFIFGPVIPILFPIAFCSLLCLYTVEKL